MRILIVEDDDALSDLLQSHCRNLGHSVDRVRQASECLDALEARPPDCVFLDVRLGDENGLDLLPRLKERRRSLRVTVMTGYEPLASASRASAGGAEYFLRKPFRISEVDAVLEKLSEHVAAGVPEGREAQEASSGAGATFVGSSAAMTEVCRVVGLSGANIDIRRTG